LYSWNADQLFLPASNAKLLTTAAALTYLTPQFQRQTPFFASGQPPALKTLRVVGQGDPSMDDAKLEQTAAALQSKGIRTIDTLMGDDTLFQGLPIRPSWAWEDVQGGDGLPVNSLMLNGNALTLQLIPQAVGQPLRLQWISQPPPNWMVQNRSKTVPASAPESIAVYRDENRLVVNGQLQVGAEPETTDIPVTNPGMAFLDRFRTLLNAHQIQVNRLALVKAPMPLPQEFRIAAIDFPTLNTLMTEINRNSNNFYAEALLRLMGSTVANPQGVDTSEQGLGILTRTLTQLGVNPQVYQLVDGSGLSRKNLVSPRALVQTLQAIARSPNGSLFRESLPLAGESGTLRRRFRNTVAQGRLRAKTGTLQGTTALSGYLDNPTYSPIVFSILVNHSTQSGAVLRQVADQIVLLIASLKPC
ncbi:MAG: D-alanyl-D-alanine carboxypeptidase/D-alanyl-D-alanine-endopeptidase, partial [Thermosynechococcaceae cyanobacterium]